MEDTTSKEKAAPFEPGWQLVLGQELEKDYMKSLRAFLLREKEQGYTIYPRNAEMFNAFKHTHFDDVKVVILGQDPYHGPGQAHGLAFSVPEGVQIPPSLRNIFKELETDIPGFKKPEHGNLMQWADRGVLLLNATLTVRAQQAGSHQNKGWEMFTDHVITTLSAKKQGLVFILWGRYAQNKSTLIDGSRHTILKAAHPSPLSAHNGFIGCRHFSLTNASLQEKGMEPIDWRIT